MKHKEGKRSFWVAVGGRWDEGERPQEKRVSVLGRTLCVSTAMNVRRTHGTRKSVGLVMTVGGNNLELVPETL